jgi:hypothetical protein
MNLSKRVRCLEARIRGKESSMLTRAYLATHRAAEQWQQTGQQWPMSNQQIQTIPHLVQILKSTPTSEQAQKIVESLRILINGGDRQHCSDEQGRFILLASPAGPIKVRGVAPCCSQRVE